MILKKPLERGSIVTLKLISGEEVIARYESESESALAVSKPSVLTSNGTGLGIMPWMISSSTGEVSLNKSTIITFTQTDEQIAKSYMEATSSIKLA
jgi:hypothetical protein